MGSTPVIHSTVPTLDRLAPTGDHARDSSAALFDYHREYLLVLQALFPEERLSGIARTLLEGSAPDTSAAELRLSTDPRTKALETQLLPAPVELPCRPGRGGDLCERPKALADVKARFGDGPGSIADWLHLMCGGAPAGPAQSCTREITEPETIRGVAGHMHLLGRKIRIEVDPGTPRARTILDIPVWDFDNQGSHPTAPIRLRRGDSVKVTCTHDQALRDRLPAFAQQRQDRYVVWGEGTTDEMCLGILLVTRP